MAALLKYLCLLMVLAFIFVSACGQPTSPSLATSVAVDLDKKTVGDIPFDKRLYLAITIPKTEPPIPAVAGITIEIGQSLSPGAFVLFAASLPRVIAVSPNSTEYIIFSPPAGFVRDFLLPNHGYAIRITAYDAAGNPIPRYSFTHGFLTKTKIGDHTKLDFGLLYSPKPKIVAGYTSLNIYFTAINDETNLIDIHSVGRNILLRTSIFLGISPLQLHSDPAIQIKNKYGIGNFVYGIAFRAPFYWSGMGTTNRVAQELLQPMRLSFGQILFKQANENLLITKDKDKSTFFVGLSYDFNIASLIGPLSKLF